MFKGIHISNGLVAAPGRKNFAVTTIVAATLFAAGSIALAQGVSSGAVGSQPVVVHSASA